MEAMAKDSSLGDAFRDGTKPVLRYSDLRFNAYGGRGGSSGEIAAIRALGELVVEDKKLSDVRVAFTGFWLGETLSRRFDQASREIFEAGEAI